MSLYGSLLHAVKYRPEISFALQPTGSALSFPTEGLYECLMRVLVPFSATSSPMDDPGRFGYLQTSLFTLSYS